MSITITAEIDGKQVPINDCNWYQFSPCGCMCAAAVAKDYDNNGWITTEDAAWKQFYERQDMIDHDKAAGYTVKIGHRNDVTTMLGTCTHTPKWGRDKTPVPAHHTWGLPERANRIHIYPNAEGKSWLYKPTAICGREHKSAHTRHVEHDRLECEKCVAEAKRIEATK